MYIVHNNFLLLKKKSNNQLVIELVYSDTFYVHSDNFIMLTMDNLKYIMSISQWHNNRQK